MPLSQVEAGLYGPAVRRLCSRCHSGTDLWLRTETPQPVPITARPIKRLDESIDTAETMFVSDELADVHTAIARLKVVGNGIDRWTSRGPDGFEVNVNQ